jgi:hypothetical protein
LSISKEEGKLFWKPNQNDGAASSTSNNNYSATWNSASENCYVISRELFKL